MTLSRERERETMAQTADINFDIVVFSLSLIGKTKAAEA